jgi:pimeloyl-ACP methyl ester carboxylesterase
MKSIVIRQNLILFTVLFLTGCASLPNVKVHDIQNRRVAYASKGEGTPVIVLESGYGALMSTWAPIFENLSEVTRVFAYDRPGYGWSTLNPTPATARELAEQLHQNLVSTGHEPPYVLVGHSAGGLYVNVFARIYPEEVVGVVLIDSSHPYQFEYYKKELPHLYSEFASITAKEKKGIRKINSKEYTYKIRKN